MPQDIWWIIKIRLSFFPQGQYKSPLKKKNQRHWRKCIIAQTLQHRALTVPLGTLTSHAWSTDNLKGLQIYMLSMHCL